jgi:NAD(P)H dehydrogenase (quinone)
MNVFIVYAHPEPKSFDAVMRDYTIDTLTQAGHIVDISDLYQMRFKTVSDVDDFTMPLNPLTLDIKTEQKHAAENGTFTQDILAEQRKLQWCDVLILQFPLWWYAVPAIMKGWIDRVFAYGFAYGRGRKLDGKRAMLVMTTGGTPAPFTSNKQRVLSDMLDYLQRGTLDFCGFEVLPPFAVYGAADIHPEQREQVLLQYAQMLRALAYLPPIEFR